MRSDGFEREVQNLRGRPAASVRHGLPNRPQDRNIVGCQPTRILLLNRQLNVFRNQPRASAKENRRLKLGCALHRRFAVVVPNVT
jgi:hypothetical protein